MSPQPWRRWPWQAQGVGCERPCTLRTRRMQRTGAAALRRGRWISAGLPHLLALGSYSKYDTTRLVGCEEAGFVAPVLPPHSQPTAYCAHATQPAVPSAKRSPSAIGVGRRSARVGGSGAALWAAHPHTRLGRAGRARGVSRARRTCGSTKTSPADWLGLAWLIRGSTTS